MRKGPFSFEDIPPSLRIQAAPLTGFFKGVEKKREKKPVKAAPKTRFRLQTKEKMRVLLRVFSFVKETKVFFKGIPKRNETKRNEKKRNPCLFKIKRPEKGGSTGYKHEIK